VAVESTTTNVFASTPPKPNSSFSSRTAACSNVSFRSNAPTSSETAIVCGICGIIEKEKHRHFQLHSGQLNSHTREN
jgi:hypothetical protein